VHQVGYNKLIDHFVCLSASHVAMIFVKFNICDVFQYFSSNTAFVKNHIKITDTLHGDQYEITLLCFLLGIKGRQRHKFRYTNRRHQRDKNTNQISYLPRDQYNKHKTSPFMKDVQKKCYIATFMTKYKNKKELERLKKKLVVLQISYHMINDRIQCLTFRTHWNIEALWEYLNERRNKNSQTTELYLCYKFLCFSDRALWFNSISVTNLMHLVFYSVICILHYHLNMFRALQRSSSGGLN
jgi:hypothetical protein